jgi:dihydrofolate synthase/folylpolyglutamate synthase
MEVLGNTLSEIAWEKCGIIKEGGTIVVYPQEKEVYDVIKSVCDDKNASLLYVDGGGINLKDFLFFRSILPIMAMLIRII